MSSNPSLQTHLFINNSYVSPSKSSPTITLHNPTTSSLISSSIPIATEADVDAAVQAARAALPGWKATSAAKRAECMLRFAEGLEREVGRLAELGK